MATITEIHNYHNAVRANSLPMKLWELKTGENLPKWPSIYQTLTPELPQKLNHALSVISTLHLCAETRQDLVENLLAQGEDSTTYNAIQELLQALGKLSLNVTRDNRIRQQTPGVIEALGQLRESIIPVMNSLGGAVSEHDFSYMKHLRELSSYNTLTPEDTALSLHLYSGAKRNQGSWQQVYTIISALSPRTNMLLLEDSLNYFDPIGKSFINDLIAEAATSFKSEPMDITKTEILWPLVQNLEFITEEKVEEFNSLIGEYNWEWALAAMEWGDGAAPTLIPTMKRFVAESPWEK